MVGLIQPTPTGQRVIWTFPSGKGCGFVCFTRKNGPSLQSPLSLPTQLCVKDLGLVRVYGAAASLSWPNGTRWTKGSCGAGEPHFVSLVTWLALGSLLAISAILAWSAWYARQAWGAIAELWTIGLQ